MITVLQLQYNNFACNPFNVQDGTNPAFFMRYASILIHTKYIQMAIDLYKRYKFVGAIFLN